MKNVIKLSKKAVLVLGVLLMSATSFSQSVFDRFEDQEDVGSIILNQKMFRMIATMGVNVDDPEVENYVNMANSITGFKVFTTADAKVSADMKATVTKYLKSTDLEELMRIKDGDQTVKFYVKEGKDDNHVKELLMFVTGVKAFTKDKGIKINDGKSLDIETVIMSLTGDIDLREVSKIANQMDIPGGEQLGKASKKKN